jgi:hypothetical protein
LPILINYILAEFDSRINAYQKIDQNIKLTKDEIPELFLKVDSYPLRYVEFPDGCSLSITVKTGGIVDGIIRSTPEITVSKKASILHTWRIRRFRIGQNPPTIGGDYHKLQP